MKRRRNLDSYKTKYIILRVTEENKEKESGVSLINQEEYTFERVEQFVYPRVVIDEEGKEMAKSQREQTKNLIRQTVIHVSKSWVLNKVEEELLKKWKRKILRRG